MRRIVIALLALALLAPAAGPTQLASARKAEPAKAAKPLPPDAFQLELEARKARWAKQRGKPEAVIAVLGALELWEDVSPAAVTAFLEAAAKDGKAHPLARAHAAFAAEFAAVARGDEAAAAKWRAELGLIESWRVIGPFGFDGGDLIGTPYGPESGIRDVEQGKRGEVGWRVVEPGWVRHGLVPLGGMLRPDTQSVGYALTYVFSDKPRDCVVRIGSTGAIKVWVSGRLALSNPVKARPRDLDQDAGAARLEKGWNPVLVKLAVEDNEWFFRLRFTDAAGKTLVLRAAHTPPQGEPVVAGKPGKPPEKQAKAPKPPATLRSLLEARAAKAKGPALEAARRDLAVYMAWNTPDDTRQKPVQAVLDKLDWEDGAVDAETLLVVVRHTESTDQRRRAAEKLSQAQKATPAQRAEAHYRLGWYYLTEAGIPKRARDELEAALAADPRYWPAELALAEMLGDLGFAELSRYRVEMVAMTNPQSATPLRRLASLELSAGRVDVAGRLYQQLLDRDHDDVAVMMRLSDMAKDRGDTASWIAWLRRVAAARPISVGAALTLADALVSVGDVPGAIAALDAGLVVAPDDPRLLEDSGRLLVERAGKKDEGVKRLRRALVVRPQNPDLRRYLARIVPAADDDLEKQYAQDVPALIAKYRGFEANAEQSVVLLDHKVVRVHDNGLSETFVQRVVRVQDESGAAREQWQAVQYTPGTQTVELRRAKVYKPSGEIVEAKTQGTREVSEPWYGLYYDVRADMVGFEKLEPGDVVEYAYVIADVGRRNLYADYFGDVHFFGETIPVAQAEYTLLYPPSREMNWRLPKLSGLSRKDDEVGGEKRTRLGVSKLAKINADPGMPGWTEASPYVHVSTWKSWDQVARWYWRLVEEQLVSDDAVKKAAREATAGLEGEAAKVRAIHNYVVKNTRYVGLEFGIHSFKPYRVPQILERKFGDCKDKASLIVVMLREVGVKAQLVLVRTRKNGDVDEAPASLALFDHAIAYVPSLDLFLDGTAEYSGSGELPYQDQGIMVLLIDGGDGKLTRTPVFPAEKNKTSRKLRLELDGKGGAAVVEELTIEGQGAAGWRQYYQSDGERPGRYEKAMNGSLPGFKLTKVEMPALAGLEKPVTVRASGSVAQVGARHGKGVALSPLSYASELQRSLARGSKRDHDLLIDYPWTQVDEITWVLPKGMQVKSLPQAKKLAGKHGALELEVEVKEEGGHKLVVVRATRVISVRRVTVADYAGFREFLGQMDAALNQTIEIE